MRHGIGLTSQEIVAVKHGRLACHLYAQPLLRSIGYRRFKFEASAPGLSGYYLYTHRNLCMCIVCLIFSDHTSTCLSEALASGADEASATGVAAGLTNLGVSHVPTDGRSANLSWILPSRFGWSWHRVISNSSVPCFGCTSGSSRNGEISGG